MSNTPAPHDEDLLEDQPEQTQRIQLSQIRQIIKPKISGLIVIEGMNLGSTYILDKGTYLIGRSPDAHIHIDNYLVSRFHATLKIEPGSPPQCILRDLDSTNGTLLNDEVVLEKVLQDGDKIRIGDHVLKYVYQDEQDLRYHAKVHEMIRYDDLTGLLSKASFYKELSRELSRAQRRGHPVSVLMMDIDHFKKVNDTHGHLVGSAVLQQVGMLIRDTFRGEDLAGRYGGEEFITYFPETSKIDAVRGAERFKKRLETFTFRYREVQLNITISIGVATMPEDGSNLELLVRKADTALYEAKNQGRNRVVAYRDALGDKS